jgi:hypothetical protein
MRLHQHQSEGVALKVVIQMNGAPNPTWEEVERAVRSLSRHPTKDDYVTLEVERLSSDSEIVEESSLVAYFIDSYGYYVSGRGWGDKDYYTLINSSLGDESIRVWCGGDYMTRKRLAFVDVPTAIQSLKCFYDTGRRDNQLEWELDDNCG